MQTFFAPVGNLYCVAISTSASANVTMPNVAITPDTAVKVDNASTSAAFVKFTQGNTGVAVDWPTNGTNVSGFYVAPGTSYLNPGIGTYNGNITVSSIGRAAGNVYITMGYQS